MITIRKNRIPDELKREAVILYGAGFAGRECRKILQEQSINIEFLVDDDKTKWGKDIEGLPIKSYEDFVKYCSKKEKVNVVLTSIYGVQISKRIEKIPNATIYEMYDWYTEVVMPERFGEKLYTDEELDKYKKNTDDLKEYLEDDESYKVFQNLYQYMVTGNINYITEISTVEEQYFIKEVCEYLGNNEISVVDAGAYEGELIRAILENHLNVKEWYCFETNTENYQILKKNAYENNFIGKQVCVNKGLWNEHIWMNVKGDGTSSKVVEGDRGEDQVEMVTIDEFFQDIHIDLIKMDIEGAEMNALKGGMEVIKRDRPILAISIYHSIEDYYDIMKLMIRELKDYRYYVRHHSMVFCETVLYAIPK